jgi:ribosome maturation protein SDO1
MRVRITMPSKDGKRLKEKIIESAEKVEEDEFGQNDWELVRAIFIVGRICSA